MWVRLTGRDDVYVRAVCALVNAAMSHAAALGGAGDGTHGSAAGSDVLRRELADAMGAILRVRATSDARLFSGPLPPH